MWIVVIVVVVVLCVERAAYLVASAVWHAEDTGATTKIVLYLRLGGARRGGKGHMARVRSGCHRGG